VKKVNMKEFPFSFKMEKKEKNGEIIQGCPFGPIWSKIT
jgi:hypothetical protein